MVLFTDQPWYHHFITKSRSITTVLVKRCDCLRSMQATQDFIPITLFHFSNKFALWFTAALVYNTLSRHYEADTAPSWRGKRGHAGQGGAWPGSPHSSFPQEPLKEQKLLGCETHFQPGLRQQYLCKFNTCWKQLIYPRMLSSTCYSGPHTPYVTSCLLTEAGKLAWQSSES